MKIIEVPATYHVELTEEEYDIIENALMMYAGTYTDASDFAVKLRTFVTDWCDRGESNG